MRLMLLYQKPHSENHSLGLKFSFPGSVMRQYCHNNPMKRQCRGIATENETKVKRSYLIPEHEHNCIVAGRNRDAYITATLHTYP